MAPWSSVNSQDSAWCLPHGKTSNRRLLRGISPLLLPLPFTVKHLDTKCIIIALPAETSYHASYYYVDLKSNKIIFKIKLLGRQGGSVG